MKTDIFLRAHTIAPTRARRERKRKRECAVDRWPQTALVFDTETTTDTEQSLTFGAFRCCVLRDDEYRCVEEGLLYPDDASSSVRQALDAHAEREYAELGLKSFPPKLRLRVLSRSAFIEQYFWKTIKAGGLIVGFNLPFDLSRLAVEWHPSMT